MKWKGQRSALLAISPLKKQNGINMSNSTAYFNQCNERRLQAEKEKQNGSSSSSSSVDIPETEKKM